MSGRIISKWLFAKKNVIEGRGNNICFGRGQGAEAASFGNTSSSTKHIYTPQFMSVWRLGNTMYQFFGKATGIGPMPWRLQEVDICLSEDMCVTCNPSCPPYHCIHTHDVEMLVYKMLLPGWPGNYGNVHFEYYYLCGREIMEGNNL